MDFALPINTKHANGNICMNSKVLAIVTTSIAFECFHPFLLVDISFTAHIASHQDEKDNVRVVFT